MQILTEIRGFSLLLKALKAFGLTINLNFYKTSVKIMGVSGRRRIERVADINRIMVGCWGFVRHEDIILVGLGFMVNVVA